MKEGIVEMKVVMMMMMGISLILMLLFNFFNNFLGHSLNAVEEIWMGGASLFFGVKLVPQGSQFLGSGRGSWVFGCVHITCPYLVLLRLGFGSSQLQSVCPPLHQCRALTIHSIIFAIFTICPIIFTICSIIFTIRSIILTIRSIILTILSIFFVIFSIIIVICSIIFVIFFIFFVIL